MAETLKEYRLRSMYLVNAATNRGKNSGRITQLDPRGGAAVMGPNGVGKTTTLRMMLLFLTLTPTQLLAGSGRKDSIVEFLLPSSSSAIAFEYQRGSSNAQDIRTVVVRRRSDDPNVPFYRFYKSEFRRELFVENGQFLDDAATQQKASVLGIATSPKLATAEYRTVLLRTSSRSKEMRKFHALALDYSLGPKSLENLDRIASTMLKEKIDFEDIVHIIVDLVQADLGLDSEKDKLLVRLNKQEVEALARNRRAVEQAVACAPRVAEMNESLKTATNELTKFEALSLAVRMLKDVKSKAAGDARRIARELQDKSIELLHENTQKRKGLLQVLMDAQTAHTQVAAAAREAANRLTYFKNEDAHGWLIKTGTLGSLETQHIGLVDRISALEASSASLTQRFDRLIEEATLACSAEQLKLEQSKQAHQNTFAESLRQIDAALTQANETATEESEARSAELAHTTDAAIASQAAASEKVTSPRESDAAAEALAKAYEAAREKQQAYQESNKALADVGKRLEAAEKEVSNQELEVKRAKRAVEAASDAVERAQAYLTPVPGSMLEALLACPEDSWRRDVAPVLNPSLLSNTTLAPKFDPAETNGAMFGWSLNTSALATPEWCDREQAKEALQQAKDTLVAAEARLDTQSDLLREKEAALAATKKLVTTEQAKNTVFKQHLDSAELAVNAAKATVERERKNALALAQAELAKATAALAEARLAQKNEREALARTLKALKQESDAQKEAAREVLTNALKSVDSAKAQLKANLDEQVKALNEDRDRVLKEESVDVDQLNALKKQAAGLKEEISDIKAKDYLVKDWTKWSKEVGEVGVASLEKEERSAQSQVDIHQKALGKFDGEAKAAQDAVEGSLQSAQTRANELEEDVRAIDDLDPELIHNPSSLPAALDENIGARDLRTKVSAERRKLDDARRKLERDYTSVFSNLMAGGESKVREFVDRTMAEHVDSDVATKALVLNNCYHQIQPEIVEHLNLGLQTQLQVIQNVSRTIDKFVSEVNRYNKKMQAGFAEVQRFERLSDLKVEISTNFDTLGFYSKLGKMKDAIRAYFESGDSERMNELPPQDIVNSLRDFASTLSDGNLDIHLASHITLRGQLTDNGKVKEFKRASELQNISSTGLSSLVLTTILTALINTIRGDAPVYIPFVSDEVGKYDPSNFVALKRMLGDNYIDLVTASPELGPSQQSLFANVYLFGDGGRIQCWAPCRTTGYPQE